MVREMMMSTRRPKWKELATRMVSMGYNRSSNALMCRKRYLQDAKPEIACVRNLVKTAVRNVIRKRIHRGYSSQWQKDHRVQRRASAKKNRDNHKDEPTYKERMKKKEQKGRKRASARELHRYHTDAKFNVIKKLRMRLHNLMASRGLVKRTRTTTLTGMDGERLVSHLEQQRPDLPLSACQIDHIFPLARHLMDTMESQKQASHFSNLQPLTEAENLSKMDKLPTKAMAAKVERWAWPPGVTEDMLPEVYEGWSTPLRM